MLELNNISFAKKDNYILNNINFKIEQNEIIGIIGKNGAGKTTLLKIIVGLLKPINGKIYYNNIDVSKYPVNKRISLGMGYLAQHDLLLNDNTVFENLFIVGEFFFKSKKQIQNSIDELLSIFIFTKNANKKVMVLSGGERRILGLMINLIKKPKFLILDELFLSLDDTNVQNVIAILSYKLKFEKISAIMTDQTDLKIKNIVNKIFIIDNGVLYDKKI